METIKENYKKNVDILKENLKRGMSTEQANSVVNNFESQLKNAGFYDKDGKDFINAMRSEIVEYATSIKVMKGKK